MPVADRICDRGGALSEVDRWAYARQASQAAEDVAAIERRFRQYARFYRALLLKQGRLPEDRDTPILDLPCGEGAMVYALREMGYHNVAGFDLDQGRLATGQKLRLPIGPGEVFQLLADRPDGSVGCVLSMDFLEHLDKPQVVTFLAEALRVLEPGGRLIVRTPCADAPQGASHVYNDFTHKWAATSGVLRQLLTAAGFEGVEVFGEHPTWAMSYGLIRVPLFRLITGSANLLLRGAGLTPYVVWSSSMWGIGRKKR